MKEELEDMDQMLVQFVMNECFLLVITLYFGTNIFREKILRK